LRRRTDEVMAMAMMIVMTIGMMMSISRLLGATAER
jgi:hypothetical protein